jgi:hypothetical protein
MKFIQQHERRNEKVYVHCRAGHGRSAAITYAWLLTKNPHVDLQQLNEELCSVRNVRKTLYRQPNLLKFHSILLQQLKNGNNKYADDDFDMDDEDDDDEIDKGSPTDYIDSDDDDDDNDGTPLYSFKNIEDEL